MGQLTEGSNPSSSANVIFIFKTMKQEDWYLQNLKKEALGKRKKFDALSLEDKKKKSIGITQKPKK